MKYTEKDLSLVIPARDNLKYAKWGYEAMFGFDDVELLSITATIYED